MRGMHACALRAAPAQADAPFNPFSLLSDEEGGQEQTGASEEEGAEEEAPTTSQPAPTKQQQTQQQRQTQQRQQQQKQQAPEGKKSKKKKGAKAAPQAGGGQDVDELVKALSLATASAFFHWLHAALAARALHTWHVPRTRAQTAAQPRARMRACVLRAAHPPPPLLRILLCAGGPRAACAIGVRAAQGPARAQRGPARTEGR